MIDLEILKKAYQYMCLAKQMASTYEQHRAVCKYVHSTSRGHEAIQLALAFQLSPQDFVSPYYRDESLLLGLGYSPYQLMLQLLARAEDPFSGGREYYSHPNARANGKPVMPHQSSATGMQVIPATGMAQGIQYFEKHLPSLLKQAESGESPVVVCSLGDASVTEGEVSEALQFAVLKQLPILYLVQDNGWGISARAEEARSMDAFAYAAGFPGLERLRVNGAEFVESYSVLETVINTIRKERRPFLVQADLSLLGHHTSGVRKESYRAKDELLQAEVNDPRLLLQEKLLGLGVDLQELSAIDKLAEQDVHSAFQLALAAPEPDPAAVSDFIFVPTPVVEEKGLANAGKGEKIRMVDAALFAIREILETYPEAIFFGQDVGRRLGGVFREAATLAEQFGDHRVFNTAIQEAYIIGSTAGLSAVGIKPIVEIQFGDYCYPGLNQLASEIAKSSYLSCGKFPVQTLIRIPVGAYGGGGPYHSASIETTLLSIKGIKVVYPSNAADMKGLMKAAFLDPNPVIMLEHKGLYWSKLPGTESAMTDEPDRDYILPLGKAAIALPAYTLRIKEGRSCCVITYGMGVYWAKAAASFFPGQVEVIDLRCLFPLDEDMVYQTVRKHGKCLVLTEEQQTNSFAEALAGRISLHCFRWLDAPVEVLGALDLPAVPMNAGLEAAMLPDAGKVKLRLEKLLEA